IGHVLKGHHLRSARGKTVDVPPAARGSAGHSFWVLDGDDWRPHARPCYEDDGIDDERHVNDRIDAVVADDECRLTAGYHLDSDKGLDLCSEHPIGYRGVPPSHTDEHEGGEQLRDAGEGLH